MFKAEIDFLNQYIDQELWKMHVIHPFTSTLEKSHMWPCPYFLHKGRQQMKGAASAVMGVQSWSRELEEQLRDSLAIVEWAKFKGSLTDPCEYTIVVADFRRGGNVTSRFKNWLLPTTSYLIGSLG